MDRGFIGRADGVRAPLGGQSSSAWGAAFGRQKSVSSVCHFAARPRLLASRRHRCHGSDLRPFLGGHAPALGQSYPFFARSPLLVQSGSASFGLKLSLFRVRPRWIIHASHGADATLDYPPLSWNAMIMRTYRSISRKVLTPKQIRRKSRQAKALAHGNRKALFQIAVALIVGSLIGSVLFLEPP